MQEDQVQQNPATIGRKPETEIGGEDWSQWGSEKPEDIVAVDFETYYDKEVSLRTMSPWAYVYHPKTFPYLMSLETEGWRWVGDPREFTEWERLDGKTLAAHNASFDSLVWQRMCEDPDMKKAMGGCKPRRWVCTADMVAYMRCWRSLQSCVKALYGVDISKDVRSSAAGKTKEDIVAEGGWDDMLKYGGSDAHWCYRLAHDFLSQWPPLQQFISYINRVRSWQGICIDVPYLEDSIANLERIRHEFLSQLPWYPELVPLSVAGLRAQARKDGFSVPASLDKKSDEAIAFFEKYGEQFPYVLAFRDYRQANTMLNKCISLRDGLREDGTFPLQSVYYGTHTGRLAAGVKAESASEETGGKFNHLNLPRKPLQGVDLRRCIIPPKGYKFYCVDWSQIEARLLLWYAGDTATLALIREQGFSPYEATAVRVYHLAPEDAKGLKHKNPTLYQAAKATTLGAGYQMGAKRFMAQAPILTGGGFRPTMDEAAQAIQAFRAASPGIVAFWNRQHSYLQISATNHDPTHRVRLANGRWLTYFDPQWVTVMDPVTKKPKSELEARLLKGRPFKKLYGGKITEHIMQSTGYEILSEKWAQVEALEKAHVVFTVYDELVVCIPEDRQEEYVREIDRILTAPVSWLPGLPLQVEGHVESCYIK